MFGDAVVRVVSISGSGIILSLTTRMHQAYLPAYDTNKLQTDFKSFQEQGSECSEAAAAPFEAQFC